MWTGSGSGCSAYDAKPSWHRLLSGPLGRDGGWLLPAAALSVIIALRRPTRSAWILNRFARAEPDVVSQLTELGAALSQAQQTLDGAGIRELSQQRRVPGQDPDLTLDGAGIDGAGLTGPEPGLD